MKYLLLGMALLAGAAQAQDHADPDWPCVQRKQPHLSLGQMWTGPQPDDAVRALAAQGADPAKGVLRMSFVHYTTRAEVDQLIGALDRVL